MAVFKAGYSFPVIAQANKDGALILQNFEWF